MIQGLSDASCNGLCAAGYYCPAGSSHNQQHACGDTADNSLAASVYCPEGSGSPVLIGPGNYSTGSSVDAPHTRTGQLPCPAGYYCFQGVQVSTTRHGSPLAVSRVCVGLPLRRFWEGMTVDDRARRLTPILSSVEPVWCLIASAPLPASRLHVTPDCVPSRSVRRVAIPRVTDLLWPMQRRVRVPRWQRHQYVVAVPAGLLLQRRRQVTVPSGSVQRRKRHHVR